MAAARCAAERHRLHPLSATLARQERLGAKAALLVHLVRSAIEQGHPKHAAGHARALLAAAGSPAKP